MIDIIAEISANHGHSLDIVKKTILAAKNAGATAVKIQSYTADMLSLNCLSKDFIVKGGTIWDGRSLHDLYSQGAMSWEWHEELFTYCELIGIEIFSTPFNEYGVQYLNKLGVGRFKIASAEITHIPLLKEVAKTKKPVILSTGMAHLNEIEEALEIFESYNREDITVLKCTSSYPTPLDEVNLSVMQSIRNRFKVKVGLSDHTQGFDAAVLSVALGACLVEKHFILDRGIGGPDASFSVEPTEFTLLVQEIRKAEKIMGSMDFKLTSSQVEARRFMRSIYVSSDIRKGECFSEDNIKIVRPGYSLAPKHYEGLLQKKSNYNYKIGDRIDKDEIL